MKSSYDGDNGKGRRSAFSVNSFAALAGVNFARGVWRKNASERHSVSLRSRICYNAKTHLNNFLIYYFRHNNAVCRAANLYLAPNEARMIDTWANALISSAIKRAKHEKLCSPTPYRWQPDALNLPTTTAFRHSRGEWSLKSVRWLKRPFFSPPFDTRIPITQWKRKCKQMFDEFYPSPTSPPRTINISTSRHRWQKLIAVPR